MNMYRKAILLAGFSFSFFGPPSAAADDSVGPQWEATGRVDLTVGNDFQRSLSTQGITGGTLADVLEQIQPTAQARGEYSIISEGYTLRATASVSALGEVETEPNSFLGASARARANIFWSDTIFLSGEGDSLPFNDIQFNWIVDGSFIGTVDETARFASSAGSAEFDMPTSNDPIASVSRHLIWEDDELFATGPIHVSRRISFSHQIALGTPTPVAATFEIDVTTNGGAMFAQFGNTARLSSITFADGTTPESRGFALSFGSGVVSPNLAIPEPNATWFLGGLTLWVMRRRRAVSAVQARERFLRPSLNCKN